MHELSPESLLRRCAAGSIPFRSTGELENGEVSPGQERARSAIGLAARMSSHGHNVYVMGRPGSGRHAVALRVTETEAAGRPPADDWCYLNNFDDPRRPQALRLPRARGAALRQDMRQLIAELRVAVPAALESEAYVNRRSKIDEEFDARARAALETLQTEAERNELGILQTQQGFAITPLRNGHPLSPQDFAELPEADQARRRSGIDEFSERLREHVENLPEWSRERRKRIRELDRETTRSAIGSQIAELRAQWAGLAAVVSYLDRVEADLLEHAPQLLRREPQAPLLAGLEQIDPAMRFERYEVNVVVDNSALGGAPTVYEGNPTFMNLVGRVENTAQFGALVTNFTMIRPGALHRANGGFLLIDAERILLQPFAWDALKRALFERCVRIDSPGQLLSLVSTVSLEPEPVPLDIRVVLVGTRRVYQLLGELDPDFAELFRVVADFDEHVDRSPDSERECALMIAGLARSEGLRPLHCDAVARLIEHAARLSGDAGRLSTHTRSLEDIVREADHWAGTNGHAQVDAADVQRAIDEQTWRLSRVHGELVEAVRRANLLIDCTGTAIGQANGLFVFQVGSMPFGQPVRITATARVGDGELVDIEREVDLGGPIHSKGVMILAGLIGSRYGLREPLSLHARIVFEQTYSGIEGDSASLAEACTLLSALAAAPVRQDLAVTGSVNQHGQVQPVGGINEKIEGFFDVCQAGGLTGSQGVIIPAANAQHLMLRHDVVAAAAEGRFHVHAVGHVDEAIALLSGLPAGERERSGDFTPRSLNARVEERLVAFAQLRHRFSGGGSARRRYRKPPDGR